MSALIDVILPVFLVIGFGWIAARAGLFPDAAVDGVMRFTQGFALPCVLFRGVARLDLDAAYDPGLMIAFYAGAFTGFGLCFAGARWLFRRPPEDCVAIGFAGMFSNSLLLGLPITERAFGPDALAGNIAIISVHSPIIYTTGIGLMEWVRARGRQVPVLRMSRQIARAVLHQPLVIGILLGFAVNLTGLPLPAPLWSAVDMMAAAALPAALFALGGVLYRYRPEGDRATIAMICTVSLVVHPAIAWTLARGVFGLDDAGLRSLILTAAMAPGVNAYMFAHLYGVGKRVNASAVLFGTALSIPTIWLWLQILP